MKKTYALLAAALAAALPMASRAKGVATAPADIRARFDQQIDTANTAYNMAQENYGECENVVKRYDVVLDNLAKLAENYERVRSEFAGYRNDVDAIQAGKLEESRIPVLTNQFARLHERVRSYKGELNDLEEASVGATFDSASREFQKSLQDFLDASREANELTYVPGSVQQYEDLSALYRDAYGMYGAVNLDNVTPDRKTRLGALRVWRDDMHLRINEEMRKKLDARGAHLAKIARDSAEIGETLGLLRSKFELPEEWEGNIHEYYKALLEWTKPRTAKVTILHRFNGPAEPFKDLPEFLADMNQNLILPPECNVGNMQARMAPGWKFAGWALRDGTPVESDSMKVEGPLSIYAQREEIPVRVVFLNEEGESVRVANLLRVTDQATIDRPEDPEPRWGWKFEGWRIQGSETRFARWGVLLSEIVSLDTPNDRLSIAFEPVWEAVPFEVAFIDGEERQVKKLTVLDMIPEVPLAEKPGWTSLGWASVEGSATADVKAGAPLVDYIEEPATRIDFHAVREVIPYKVTLLSRTADSAEPVAYGEPLVGSVVQPVDEPDAPELAHYEFDGWRIGVADGRSNDFSRPVLADTTLVAAWKPVPYAVRLGSAEGELIDYLVGDPWNIERELTPPPAPSAGEKYDFCQWTEQVPAEGTAWLLMPDDEAPAAFAFGAPVASDINLYPVFRHRRYTVTFRINNSKTWKTVSVLHGDAIEDPGTPVTEPVQLVLRYWQAVPGPSRPYDFSTPVTKNLTLSTIWQKKEGSSSSHKAQ